MDKLFPSIPSLQPYKDKPDACPILGLIIIAKYRQVFALANSHLSQERHEVVWNTKRVFTQDARWMCASWVEVTKQSGVPILFGCTEITNDVLNELLGTAIRIRGPLRYISICQKELFLSSSSVYDDNRLTVGSVSGIGITAGSPYTVAEDENTIFLTPDSFMAWSSITVPVILLW